MRYQQISRRSILLVFVGAPVVILLLTIAFWITDGRPYSLLTLAPMWAAFSIGAILVLAFAFFPLAYIGSFSARSLPLLPFILAVVSYPYWLWYARHLPRIDDAFFEVSAQIIPVLLLAIIVDIRQARDLEISSVALPVFFIIMGEIVTLLDVAAGGDKSGYAVTSATLTAGLVTLIMAVIADFRPPAKKDNPADVSRSSTTSSA